MALSTTVTKKSITIRGVDSYLITLNMQYKDGETVLIDRDFTCNYKRGQSWSTVTPVFRAGMKAAIAEYKALKVVEALQGYTDCVTSLNSTVGI